MKARRLLLIPVMVCLFASCITPAYRDKGFFHQDPSAERYGDRDPFTGLHGARSKSQIGRAPTP